MRARYPEQEGFVERDGVRIFYEVFGTGEPTVLLLPTWSILHSRLWKAQVPYLARHCRVITFDGRGNGLSSRPESADAYSDRELVADALAVMDATATGQAMLVSLSAGANWALPLAAEHPERVAGAVFIMQCPVLIFHGDEDALVPHARGTRLSELTGGTLVTIEGGGHYPQGRDPVNFNLLLHDFIKPSPAPTVTWRRARNRRKRALYISSPIGLGHVQRDIAIADELRRLRPDLEIDWLALHPACGRRLTFVHPIAAHPSRLTPICAPGASRMCSTLLWYTAGVPMELGAHDGPAPSFACPYRRCVRYKGHLGAACSHVPLSGDAHAARSTRRTASYDTRVPTRDATERFSLLNTLEHGSPLRGLDLPARIRYSLRVARQRQKPRIIKGRGERIISG
jgi:alpha/beta hydrolase fold